MTRGGIRRRQRPLVYERYFAGEDQRFGRPIGRGAYGGAKAHDSRSTTKSIGLLRVQPR